MVTLHERTGVEEVASHLPFVSLLADEVRQRAPEDIECFTNFFKRWCISRFSAARFHVFHVEQIRDVREISGNALGSDNQRDSLAGHKPVTRRSRSAAAERQAVGI